MSIYATGRVAHLRARACVCTLTMRNSSGSLRNYNSFSLRKISLEKKNKTQSTMNVLAILIFKDIHHGTGSVKTCSSRWIMIQIKTILPKILTPPIDAIVLSRRRAVRPIISLIVGGEEQQVAAMRNAAITVRRASSAGKKSVGQVRFVERGRDAFLPTIISSRAYPCHRLCSPFQGFRTKGATHPESQDVVPRRLRGSVWISLSPSCSPPPSLSL